MTTNTQRAEWAKAALEAFKKEVYSITEEPDVILGDFLANLRHYARLNNLDYEECDANGRMHFEAEILEDPDQ